MVYDKLSLSVTDKKNHLCLLVTDLLKWLGRDRRILTGISKWSYNQLLLTRIQPQAKLTHGCKVHETAHGKEEVEVSSKLSATCWANIWWHRYALWSQCSISTSPKVEHLEDALGVLSMSGQWPVHNKWMSVLPGVQAGRIQPSHFRCRKEHDTVKVIHPNKLEHTRSSFDSCPWPFRFDPGKVTTSSGLGFSGVKHPFTLHLAQQGLKANLAQITSSRCTLPVIQWAFCQSCFQ